MPEKLVIFGAGGHAKVVIDAIGMAGRHEIAFLADADDTREGTTLKGYLVCSEQAGFAAAKSGLIQAFVAIGHNATRKRIAHCALRIGRRNAGLSLSRSFILRRLFLRAQHWVPVLWLCRGV
jgi:hypothetical protein